MNTRAAPKNPRFHGKRCRALPVAYLVGKRLGLRHAVARNVDDNTEELYGTVLHAAPPAFGSLAFLADLQELRTILNTDRDAKIRMAIDRNLNVGTVTGLGFFYELASTHITEQGLDELAASHVLALLNAAGSDAVIACWDSKLTYFYIRPS